MVCNITPEEWSLTYEQHLKDSTVFDSVPVFNYADEGNFKDHQLVRFVCMIQDMLEPEIYLKTFEVLDKRTGKKSIQSGRYRDVVQNWPNTTVVEDSIHNKQEERHTLYCVSVPGVNPWVKELQNSAVRVPASLDPNGQIPSNNGSKRSFDDMLGTPETFAETAGSDDMVIVEDLDDSVRRVKKERSELGPLSALSQTKDCFVDLSHPLVDPNAKACYVKIYDWDNDKYKLNDMIDVVGFLSYDPCLMALETDDGMDGATLPPSLVPRLHAISIKKLEHVNPLVKEAEKDAVLSEAGTTFRDLHHLLTQVMMGDETCAEYMIYSIVANVYCQTNDEALGQIPLNVYNVPLVPGFVEGVYSIVRELVEKSHLMEISINSLNTSVMIPSKDYNTNKLKSGQLQLSANTVLCIDETKLEEGRLIHRGCLNFAAIKEICEKQSIQYDFTHYPLVFQTNLSVVVFSGGRSLLPCKVQVKMDPCPESVKNMDTIFKASKFLGLKETIVTKFRKYLTIVRHAELEISDNMQKTIEESFVQLRKDNPTIVVQDLHRLLIIARLASLCRGEPSLSIGGWHNAIALDQKRGEREAKSLA